MKRCTFGVLAVLLVFLPWYKPVHADAARYTIESLGDMGGAMPTVTGVNASGDLSGYVTGPTGNPQAVRFVSGQGWQVIPGLADADFSQAFGINNAGEVVGVYFRFSPTFKVRAFRYSDSEKLVDIEPVAGGSMSFGFGINANGDVVGASDSSNGNQVGFVAVKGGVSTPLPLPGSTTQACGINDAGVITGSYIAASGKSAMFRYRLGDAVATEVPGVVANSATAGCAIDAAGRVGGQTTVGTKNHAFRNTNGATVDLDIFASNSSTVEAIANGTSVGWYTTLAGNASAFVHNDADGTTDLNLLLNDAPGWTLGLAKGVNAKGVIVGEGTLNGRPAVFRLTPAKVADTTNPVITGIAANPSTIWPPKGQFETVTMFVSATDDSGVAPVCKLTKIVGPDNAPQDAQVTGDNTGTVKAVGGRTYTFIETCTDAAGNYATAAVPVDVPADTAAPTVRGIWATPSAIWPPNNKFVPVSVTVWASDDVDDSASCSLTSISGAAATEYQITGPMTANVRASKNSDGSTRVYALTVTCRDSAGNRSSAVVKVHICKDDSAPAEPAATKSSGKK